MRGTLDSMESPYPLGSLLPALLQGDELLQRWTSGLDPVLATVLVTLDCIEAYVDPRTAPDDFLQWLASWVAVNLDERWPDERRRAAVTDSASLHAGQGTMEGLRRLIALQCGVDPLVVDSGGTSWSTRAGSPLPGSDVPFVVVQVPAGTDVDRSRLEAVLADVVPAHVPVTVEVSPA